MENCRERSFTNPREMLRHLEGCSFFSEGLFRCPVSGDVGKFRTVSDKACSWFRPNLGQRLRNKIKATVDTVKSLAGSRSESGPPHGQCTACGYSPGHDRSHGQLPERGESLRSSSPFFDPSQIKMPQELLADTHQPPELQGSFSLPRRVSSSKHDSFRPALEDSPSSSHPTRLTSAVQSEVCFGSVSPPSSTGLSTAASPNHLQRDHFLVSHTGHLDNTQSVTSTQAGPGIGDYPVRQTDNGWKFHQVAPLYDASSISNPVISASLGQLGIPSGQRQSLTIQRTNLEPNLDNSRWSNFTFYEEGTLGTSDLAESFVLGNQPSFSSSATQSLPSFGACMVPLVPPVAVEKGDTTQISTSSDEITPCNHNQPLGLKSSVDDFQCDWPGCDWKPKPTGKEEKYGQYRKKHIKYTHGGHTHKCEYCGKSYTRKDNMNIHIRGKHALPNDSKRRRGSSDSLTLEGRRSKRLSLARTR
ncbi:hypothetical protein GGS26DRAFT_544440 [Hypomontagnella submonticulosa]|nr:hypothetical protein GGS26DRAFT_544440 [Hypomontagnella submonticulosa]